MILVEDKNNPGVYVHYCPGCKTTHRITTLTRNHCNAIWKFDGNMDSPTFSPSVNISWKDLEENILERCHFFITNGQIQFCGDSTHVYAGASLQMVALEQHVVNYYSNKRT